MNRTTTLIIAVLFVAGCGANLAETRADRQAVLDADRAFCDALQSGDAERFKSFIAADATFFGQDVDRGPEEVLERWRPMLGPDATTRLTWEPEEARVSSSADLAYTIGRYELRTTSESGEPAVGYGRYVTVWTKAADGSWKAAVDIGTPPGSAPLD